MILIKKIPTNGIKKNMTLCMDDSIYYLVSNNENKSVFKKKTYVYFDSMSSLYVPYETADILLVDSDPVVRDTFVKKIEKVKIKTNQEDVGRFVVIHETHSSNGLIELIEKYNNTYGCILIDENIGLDTIRTIRNLGYQNCIIVLTKNFIKQFNQKNSTLAKDTESLAETHSALETKGTKGCPWSAKKVGANGIISKNPSTFFANIKNLLSEVTMRKFFDS